MNTDIQIAEQTGEIVQLLADNAGKFYNITEMAKRFKVNRSAMGLALASLAHSGRIRASMATNRAQAYYMPTQAQLEAEARMSTKFVSNRPLKVDRHRQELYAELAAAREKIQSIG